MNELAPLDAAILPPGVRSRFAPDVNGLRIHFLEAGFETPNRPCVLLLHGFPELSYSWRKVIPVIAAAGYHVLAPDLRGYGRTTGWDVTATTGRSAFRLLAAVRDAIGLVNAVGHRETAVVGHDYGSVVAAWCAVTRPDVFRAVALMSAPFPGTARLPFDTVNRRSEDAAPASAILQDLAQLDRPRKNYQWYYSDTDAANEDMMNARQGLPDFLRGYYHYKSADWIDNKPFRLASHTAAELAKMPTYYIMDLADDMAQTVAKQMPSAAEIAAAGWLTDDELRFYVEEYSRTTFRGGLEWYRRGTQRLDVPELELFAGRTIDQPAVFISGKSDWGVYQSPGALERMQEIACTQFRGVHLVEGAGHWVQQERPAQTSGLLLNFLDQEFRGPDSRHAAIPSQLT
ncbi:MAG: alpha/beta hydrolase [Frankiales bacterium]|nr:alpha/beta hydrolase [Frankiales bacterium]